VADGFAFKSEKYELIRELGRGGMGVVYLAEDVRLKRTVAIKVLYDHLNRDSSFVVRFQKEARSVSSLRHPNVVFVHGLEVVDDSFLIDMEYVDGLSLDKFTRAARIAPPVVARIAADILAGLAACHSAGVIHRDIKPANILLDRDGVAKIADFGLAKAYAGFVTDSVRSQSSSGFFMGTPRYAPPAAWDGIDPVPGWDLYSLGVMLFEMLSGTVAYPGETPMAIMRQHLAEPLPKLAEAAPGASPQFAQVVDKLINSVDSTSPAQAEEILLLLQSTPEFVALQEGEAATTVKVALRKKPRRTGSRRKIPKRLVRVVRMISALLILIAALFWVATERSTAPPHENHVSHTTTSMTAPTVFLRPVPIGSAEAEDSLWMFTSDGAEGEASIVALNTLGVWRLSMVPDGEDGRYFVSGGWGECLVPSAGSFRYGTFEGMALLDTKGNSLSISLAKTNTRDRSKVDLYFLAKPVEESLEPAQFVQAIESNKTIQSLLYNELLVRDLPWAEAVESLMPSFPEGRVVTYRTDEHITVDGELRESLWSQFRSSDNENTPPNLPRLQAHWANEAVLLGFWTNLPLEHPSFEVFLEPGPKSASVESAHFEVRIGEDGRTVGRYMMGTQQIPWDCDWEVATSSQDGAWHAEIRIPTASFTADAIPAVGRRWRINAQVRDTVNEDVSARWGFEKLEALDHGAILLFSEDAP